MSGGEDTTPGVGASGSGGATRGTDQTETTLGTQIEAYSKSTKKDRNAEHQGSHLCLREEGLAWWESLAKDGLNANSCGLKTGKCYNCGKEGHLPKNYRAPCTRGIESMTESPREKEGPESNTASCNMSTIKNG